LWWNNNIKEAIELAVLLSDSINHIKLMVNCQDNVFVLLLSLFLNDVGYAEKSKVAYDLFARLCEWSNQQELTLLFPPPKITSPSPVSDELSISNCNIPFMPLDEIFDTSLPPQSMDIV